jgi:23S rRNA (uridine2552-2'-O)-methyltransferase
MSYKSGDHYTKKAKNDGFAARSVYKLEEIQKKWRVLTHGDKVLDLGCAPGSWSRYAKQQVGAKGKVVGVDIQEVNGFAGEFLLASVYDLDLDSVKTLLGGSPDVVISDMAPATTGDRFTDHFRQIELASAALQIAANSVSPNGHFVAKVFDGQDAPAFIQECRTYFKQVRRLKPKATRGRSVEFFVVASGRKP